MNAIQDRNAEPYALQLIDRYVASELSMTYVIAENFKSEDMGNLMASDFLQQYKAAFYASYSK
jgi:hypothetical protein